jgi:outer membrane protein assembly factor BamD
LGLVDEARKTAAVLGYNYPGSDWYKDAYTKVEGIQPSKRDKMVAESVPTPTQQEMADTSAAPQLARSKPKLPWWKLW